MHTDNKFCFKLFLLIVVAFLIITYVEIKSTNETSFHIFRSLQHNNESKLFPAHFITKQPRIATSPSIQPTRFLVNSSTSWITTTNKTRTTSSANEKAKNCSDWAFPTKIKGSKDPQIILDPDRFLYPGLIWGPNNQINGLKNAIYLAVRLNRTLVVPKFFAQYTRPGELSPYQIIDVQRLCSFVTCISIEELRERCDASFDVVFEAMSSEYPYIKKSETDTGMQILKPKRILESSQTRSLTFSKTNKTSNILTLPGSDHLSRHGYRMPPDPVILRSVFNTTAPCAIYASAYNSINIRPMNNVALPMTSLNKSFSDVSNEVLYSAITDAVRHPPCIVNAAKNYIRDVLSNRAYVALHWRYDIVDWMNRACRKPYPAWSRSLCVKLENIKPLHVARAIARALEKNSRGLNLTIDTFLVYIAAPSTMNRFVDEIHEELLLIDGGYVKPSSAINSYLKDKFSQCWEKHQWKNIEEIVSLVEMEIMLNSSWFFFSAGSTWSDNVILYRFKINKQKTVSKLYNADILQLAAGEKEVLNKI